ncbi:3'-5' exonuclease, partial [Salmonella enterica]|nr:3'-5' exonuclease [Salmonella enterica]
MELNTKQLKYSISLLAQQWLDENRLFIDTETTGLGDDAEIVEICIIDSHGFIL